MKALLYGYRFIAFKEFMHLRRDPATFVIAMLIPMIQLTIFGYVVDYDVRHIHTIVADFDKTTESRQFISQLHNTQYMDIVQYTNSTEEAVRQLRNGSVKIAVIIPPRFSQNGISNVKIMIDGSDSQVATRIRMALMNPGKLGSAGPRTEVLFNPQMRTQVFMIPGLIAVILQLVTVSLTAFSLVREREQGTLEQLMVTPVGRLGLMLGKLTPYAVIAFLEMVTVLIVGRFLFNVHINGSICLLLICSIPFIIAALSLGLLISTIAQNQGQALQFTMLITLPSILMSGFLFPRDTMPGFLYIISCAIPVTYYLDIIRGIVVRGAGFMDLYGSVLALLMLSIILLMISTSRFRKSSM